MTKKNNLEYIEQLQNYIETTQKAVHYSIERFDILIISLSTSGLIISIGFFKDIIKDYSKLNPLFLKITWWLFAFALIMNLVSQVTGYFANTYDLKVTKDLIRTEKGKKSFINVNRTECLHKTFNLFTILLNVGSLIGLITGIITLIIFISKYV
ncbi:MAG: hypothetical protein PHP72_07470 [Dysgonamonadaceae bacterium]|nr:hypothetical protein [Dysgonamonadaceae bacterium]MDD3435481.1 hypothetical protein [Patescibacteria group bacterium]MDD3940491.1 hypothetical protein [Candidatus Paceibacterota bacterium]MDD4606305.1 hypothetical protein [Dysgonamonadaceae bacterium]